MLHMLLQCDNDVTTTTATTSLMINDDDDDSKVAHDETKGEMEP